MKTLHIVKVLSLASLVTLLGACFAAPAHAQVSITATGFSRPPGSKTATIFGTSSAPSTWGIFSRSVTWTTPTKSGTSILYYADVSTWNQRRINWQTVVGPTSNFAAIEPITAIVTITWQNNANPSQKVTVTTGPLLVPVQ